MKKNRVTYKDIFDLNIKYLDFLLSKSYLTHQYYGEISLTGDQIEEEIRNILKKLLPIRYKVTHGYIAHAKNSYQEPLLSPQIDLIIVDTLVPHSIHIIDVEQGIELVPIESVVAIFEIKRSLNRKVFGDSLDHLFEIQKSIELNKENPTFYFPTGIEGLGSLYSNPLLGILSVGQTDKSKTFEEYGKEYLECISEKMNANTMPKLDVCSCLGEFIISTSDKEGKNMWAYTLRENDKKYPYLLKIRPDLVKDNTITGELSPAYFLSATLGFILLYITSITGRKANIGNYFFNTCL